jgi:hypothetical protein
MSVFGLLGFFMAAGALHRIRNIEKKLKQFDVLPREFDSGEDEPESE